MAVSLSKVRDEAPELVEFVKLAGSSLQRYPSLMGHVAKCGIVLDYSGSMSGRYARGEVQELAERALALATRFDDDGDIDVFFFGSDAWFAGQLSLSNYKGGINRLVEGRRMGSTNMVAAINEVLAYYGYIAPPASAGQVASEARRRGLPWGHKPSEPSAPDFPTSTAPLDVPAYIIVETDGEPDNGTEDATRNALIAASEFPVFFQFMGLGHNFDFIAGLSDLKGRKVDNAGFFAVPALNSLSEEKLFDALLNEYPDWVPQVKSLGMIA